jgi:ribosomal protein S3AE
MSIAFYVFLSYVRAMVRRRTMNFGASHKVKDEDGLGKAA